MFHTGIDGFGKYASEAYSGSCLADGGDARLNVEQDRIVVEAAALIIVAGVPVEATDHDSVLDRDSVGIGAGQVFGVYYLQYLVGDIVYANFVLRTIEQIVNFYFGEKVVNHG